MSYGCIPLVAAGLCASLVSVGAVATPTFDTFGPLPEATFGGSGISNARVAATRQFVVDDFDPDTVGNQGATITLALAATKRFQNPELTDDGLGTYTAQAGSNFGNPNNELDTSNSTTLGAKWNFSFFMDVEGFNGSTPNIEDFQFNIFYDFDTAEDTPLANRGTIDITAAEQAASGDVTRSEGSQNLNFGFLTTGVPGFVVPPSPVTTFNPDAVGEYSFTIQVSSLSNPADVLGTVGIDVNVIPEPAGLALLGVGLLGVTRRRRA